MLLRRSPGFAATSYAYALEQELDLDLAIL